jgi:hypothetical protein
MNSRHSGPHSVHCHSTEDSRDLVDDRPVIAMRLPPLYGFTWRVGALISLAASSLLALLAPDYVIASSLLRTFMVLFLAQISLTSIYQVFLYPKLFSPLRHLPGPSVSSPRAVERRSLIDCSQGGSFINGQLAAIHGEPSGAPARRWNAEIPNDGLMYYTALFNEERILITGTKALAEVLVHKNYDFTKPKFFTAGLGQLLGVGILLAEGEEHKVRTKACNLRACIDTINVVPKEEPHASLHPSPY